MKSINKKNKGFTLIELMVVISIISLLSSIVLASVKNVRDKAIETKFKSEIKQFITALELYKTTTGKYPYEDDPTILAGTENYRISINNSNTETTYPTTGYLPLSFIISSYLKSLPKIPQNGYTPTSNALFFQVNNKNPSATRSRRCVGDTDLPPYVIYFEQGNPVIQNYFNDLPKSENRGFTGAWSLNNAPCYSPK